MPKINLTDEEKIELLKAVNAGLEPSPDFIPKLFPGTAEKFDIQALDKAKIPTLEYAGKRSKAAILAEAGAGIGAAPLQVVRSFGKVKEDEWQNLIVQGDNLQFLKTCYRNEDPLIKNKVKGKVKLIYIDPPFATKSDFSGKDGEYSYTDKKDRAVFLETLRERLYIMKEILASNGSIYLHLDEKMSHYVKIIMDEVFGKELMVNEIIWNKGFRGTESNNIFQHAHEYILFYSKTKEYIWNQTRENYKDENMSRYNKIDENGKKYALIKRKNTNGKVYYGKTYFNELGEKTNDVFDIPIMASTDKERIDYPTGKPEKLLERIIQSSSNNAYGNLYTKARKDYKVKFEKELTDQDEKVRKDYLKNYNINNFEDDIIVDFFAGSGTTMAVAEKLGRKWIGCDFGKHSIYTIQKRILCISESKKLENSEINENKIIEVNKKNKKDNLYNNNPKPFSVVSAGAYDFSHVMALGNSEHKDTYIAFVLGLFQLGRDEDKAKKFKLTNIYADKDGSPVEVYPVWDEHYLKEIRIDEEYLKGIITQAGGRLQGEYHIITPEHCTNIGETRMKNAEGKDVIFKFLTFPYKVLEDVSHHLELHEQPASQGAVNELITSTAFYFNEDVEIELKREVAGLKLTKFETKILNKDGNRFPGFEGLAMLLIDVDHEKGKPFDMDKTIFAKEVDENGLFKIENIIDKNIAVIGIDKHGNESNPFILK